MKKETAVNNLGFNYDATWYCVAYTALIIKDSKTIPTLSYVPRPKRRLGLLWRVLVDSTVNTVNSIIKLLESIDGYI